MQLEINNLSINYTDFVAVENVSLNLEKGLIGCLLGPSGCGKTSLLRCVAGFEKPTSGQITIAGRRVSDTHHVLSPEQRKIGMVFQDFALFPHLSVYNNIGFGIAHQNKQQRQQRIQQLAELIDLTSLLNNYPHQLSGGQQQRVALARAMAPKPELLLLDEPFGSQDAERREHLARDIAAILKQDDITALLVTHDQLEAFEMAERIGVMQNGHLHQWASPYDLYHRPGDLFVADFIGRGTLLPAELLNDHQVDTELGVLSGEISTKFRDHQRLQLLVRPDDVIHDDGSAIQAKIVDRAFRGADFLYTLALTSGNQLLCFAPSHHDHAIGQNIGIRLNIEHLVLFPA